MERWNLTDIPTPEGTRSPVVLHSHEEEARAILIGLEPGQGLGDHEVREGAYVTVLEGTIDVDGDGGPAGPGSLFYFEARERRSIKALDHARILMFLAPWPGEGHFEPGEEHPRHERQAV